MTIKKDLPIIDDYRAIGRRDLLRQWGPPAVAGVALASLGLGLAGRPGRHQPPATESLASPKDWRTQPDVPGRAGGRWGPGTG